MVAPYKGTRRIEMLSLGHPILSAPSQTNQRMTGARALRRPAIRACGVVAILGNISLVAKIRKDLYVVSWERDRYDTQ